MNDEIPDEIMMQIGLFLTDRELLNLKQCCKKMNRVFETEVWYRLLFKTRFLLEPSWKEEYKKRKTINRNEIIERFSYIHKALDRVLTNNNTDRDLMIDGKYMLDKVVLYCLEQLYSLPAFKERFNLFVKHGFVKISKNIDSEIKSRLHYGFYAGKWEQMNDYIHTCNIEFV